MLDCAGISKRFGRVRALDGIDFRAGPGEIHAIIGENGAGKSTFVNILAGRLAADAGTITLDGVSAARLGAPEGIAAVFQSPMLFERMSWEENVALGCGVGLTLDPDRIAAQAGARAAQLGFALPPRGVKIADCSIGARVRIEILRVLSLNPRVLLLDEPTSVLAPAELESFFQMLRRLRAEGRIVILITHKLAEARAVADRISILRGGRKVAERAAPATTDHELAHLMIGEVTTPSVSARRTSARAVPALEIDRLVYAPDRRRLLDEISLRLDPGEIVGVAGVEGNGQAELIALLASLVRADSGRLDTHGNQIVALPQDRDRDGLILDMSLWENLLLSPALRRRCARPAGLLDRRRATRICRELLASYAIRADGPGAAGASLSGGNRQRLMIARGLAGDARVVVAHDPCRGLDLRGAAEVRGRLRQFAEAGGAVLLISTDLDEITAVSDRIYVLARGRLRELAPDLRDPGAIGMLMSGAA